ncbi:50S ribosomal protein L22 [Candidatus Saccharibacteria bacterium]|jgi:large subunit ribosomal protein L22|nr:50S ribosomal protein L22 [Candidatus Saccharibacteria bacterium]
MDVVAKANGVRISRRKTNLVAGLVRGRTVGDALTILEHTPNRSAKDIAKAISSARANATHNHNVKSDSLVVTRLEVSQGTMMKRFRAGARGRAKPYRRHSCNILVVVTGDVRPAKADKTEKATAKAATIKSEATKKPTTTKKAEATKKKPTSKKKAEDK